MLPVSRVRLALFLPILALWTLLALSIGAGTPLCAHPAPDPWRYPRMVGGNLIHAGQAHVVALHSAVDAAGRLYVAGNIVAVSPNPQSAGLAQMHPPATLALGGGRTDVFVARFRPGGDALDYLVHLGGSADDHVSGLTVDGAGRAYVAGWTESTDFPSASAHTAIGDTGGRDAFVLLVNAEGTALSASVRIGGTNADEATAVELAPDGDVVLAGTTASSALPTTEGALQRTHRGNVNGLPFTVRQAGFDLGLAPEILAVVDAANFSDLRLASGGLATLFGRQLTAGTAHAGAVPLPMSLADMALRIRLADGAEMLAPLLYVSPGQVNFQIPDSVVGAVEFRVENGQRVSAWTSANVQSFFSSLFELAETDGSFTRYVTFAGYAQLNLPEGAVRITPLGQRSASGGWDTVPVDRGPAGSKLHIVLFGTGFPKDATLEEYRGPSFQSRFTVEFAGPHPDFVGLQQINIRIPRDVFISGIAMFDVSVRGQRTRQLPIRFLPLAD